MNILILSSNYRFASTLSNVVENQGHHADCALISHAGLAEKSAPDLILAELSRDDYGLLLQIQGLRWTSPIIVFSDGLLPADRVFCIERGVVYFMSRDYEPSELLAYILGLQHRLQGQPQPLRYGNTSLDPESCQLQCGKKSVRLSSREFHVMHILLQSKPRIVSKQELLTRVWGNDSTAVENHVEVYIGFLRKKLQSIDSDLRISTARRMGYHLDIIHK